jgi:hypothetical protein
VSALVKRLARGQLLRRQLLRRQLLRGQFSKPVLERSAGQDSVAEVSAHMVQTGRSTAAATIAPGVERAPSSVPAAGSPLAVRVLQAAVAGAALLLAARDQPNIGEYCSPRRRRGVSCYHPRQRRPRRRASDLIASLARSLSGTIGFPNPI